MAVINMIGAARMTPMVPMIRSSARFRIWSVPEIGR
jgi:hypothetical protein